MVKVGEYIFPGDIITIAELFDTTNEKIDLNRYKHVLGPGIKFDRNKGLISTLFGILKIRYKENLQSKFNISSLHVWVENCGNSSKNSHKNEKVLGIVLKNSAQEASYLINLNPSIYDLSYNNRRVNTLNEYALLPELDFEGATKRNKPELKSGDLIFGTITESITGIDPVISCKASTFSTSSLDKYSFGILISSSKLLQYKNHFIKELENSNFKSFGISPLSGYFWNTSNYHIIKLLQNSSEIESSNLLRMIGKVCPFEIVIGMNGRIWIKARKVEKIFKIYIVLQSLKYMKISKCVQLWSSILNRLPQKSDCKSNKTVVQNNDINNYEDNNIIMENCQ